MKRTILVLATSIGLFTACSSKKSTTAAPATVTEEEPTEKTDEEVVAGITSGIHTSAVALQSTGTLMVDTTAFRARFGLSDAFPIESFDDECDPDRSGWPKGFGDNIGSSGGTFEYNKAFVGCLLKQPDGRGETVIGAVASIVTLICAAGDQLVFDGEEHDVDLDLTKSCYLPGQADQYSAIAGGGDTLTVQITASKEAFDVNTTGKWDGSVRMKFTGSTDEGEMAYDQIYLFKLDDENQIYSFATTYGPDADKTHMWPYAFGWALSIDMANGILRYEGRQQELDLEGNTESGKTRHTRAIIEGTMGATGFTDLTHAELLTGNASVHNDVVDAAAIKSVIGNTADGLYMKTLEGNVAATIEEISSYTVPQEGCITTGSACTGNTGMKFTKDADLAFFMISDDTTSLKDWFISVVPLTFDAVTTEDYQY